MPGQFLFIASIANFAVTRRTDTEVQRSEGESGMVVGASSESGAAASGGTSSTAPPRKGKSCKGCLYYSSVLKSRGYNPICVGIPRSIPQGHKP